MRDVANASADARYRLVEWLQWLNLEIDNLRSVLRRCVRRGDYQRGLDLASSMGWYWTTRATSEGVRWLDELLAAGGATPHVDARAYFMRGFRAQLQGDHAAAIPAFERAAAAARATGQRRVLTETLAMASVAEAMAGNRVAASGLLEEAEAVLVDFDNLAARLAVVQARALNAMFDGDLAGLTSAAVHGTSLARDANDLYALQSLLIDQAFAAFVSGDMSRAKSLFVEALGIADQLDDRVAQHYVLAGLGCCAASMGQTRLAAQLLGATESLRAGAGLTVNAMLASFIAQAKQSASADLGEVAFEAAFEAGLRYRRSDTVRLALGRPSEDGLEGDFQDQTAVEALGQRESQVARLVATGMTNKQIGAQLLISERTVESHIRGIMNRLGFNSRAQIASWMARDEPQVRHAPHQPLPRTEWGIASVVAEDDVEVSILDGEDAQVQIGAACDSLETTVREHVIR